MKLKWTIKRNCLCIFLLLQGISIGIKAQEVLVVFGGQVHAVTVNGCTTVTPVSSCITNAFSIALHKDTLYYTAGNKLYRAIREGNKFTGCTELTSIQSGNALTVDENGKIYLAAGKALYRINPANGQVVKLGDMPFTSAGDMIFYKQELYLAANDGLVKVNINNPALSTLAIAFSNYIVGLATTPLNCTTNQVFGLQLHMGNTKMVLLDINNGTVSSEVCALPYMVLDAASAVESGIAESFSISGLSLSRNCAKIQTSDLQINLSKPGNFSFQLDNGPLSANNVFTQLSSGPHHLRVRSASGCVKDTNFIIPPYPNHLPLQPEIRQPTCTEKGQIRFTGISSSHELLFNGNRFPPTHIFSDLLPGDYKFILAERGGCKLDSVSIALRSAENCDTLFFPNAFTPNGDNLNDTFKPGMQWLKEYRLTIYNRLGEKVFSSTDVSRGWDGMFRQAIQPEGVYVWLATYTTANSEQVIQKGTLMLLR